MIGAPPRPGRIGEEGTNTKDLTREFIAKALPNRKYNGDDLLPRVILRFVDDLHFEINTKDVAMRPSKRGQNKHQRTDDGRSSGADTGGSEV